MLQPNKTKSRDQQVEFYRMSDTLFYVVVYLRQCGLITANATSAEV
jgi:hypothetical protein